MATTTTSEIIDYRGRSIAVPGLIAGGKKLIVGKGILKVARMKDEWYDDPGDARTIIEDLQNSALHKPDIFTFWQRLPETEPLYPYRYEWEAISAVPLRDYSHWWHHQIRTDTRKKIKRPEKRGIVVRIMQLDDKFVEGVLDVFNETPIRRGRRFWHYGKDFATTKELLSRDIAISKFIGAYFEDKLVGFVKLVYAGRRFANPGLIVSKLAFRTKYVNNVLIAKAVELCTADGIPYLTYTNWRTGDQAEFLRRHGFEKTLVPRYWIPLTLKGALAVNLGLQRDIRSYLSDDLRVRLRNWRGALYQRLYANQTSPET